MPHDGALVCGEEVESWWIEEGPVRLQPFSLRLLDEGQVYINSSLNGITIYIPSNKQYTQLNINIWQNGGFYWANKQPSHEATQK